MQFIAMDGRLLASRLAKYLSPRGQVGGDEFFIDLLFYHLKLRCYVVVELKTTPFKPEYAGQLNFYLSAIDAQVKAQEDQPTIGLLLCKEKGGFDRSSQHCIVEQILSSRPGLPQASFHPRVLRGLEFNVLATAFLSCFGMIRQHFALPRHQMNAACHRAIL